MVITDRWIPRGTVPDIYRQSPCLVSRKEGNVLFNDALNTFYLRLCGVGLVSCLPVLLLNFENHCRFFFLKSIYDYAMILYGKYIYINVMRSEHVRIKRTFQSLQAL